MNPLVRWLAGRGIALPTTGELIQGGIAVGLVALALLCGWLLGRIAGPRLSALWKRFAGGHREGLGERLGTATRYAISALLLALIANAWVWGVPAAIAIGLAMGATVALCLRSILRGLQLPRWATWLVAATVFVLVLSSTIRNATNNFNLLALLDSIGFTVGSRHLSLLSLIVIVIGAIVLVAVVRLANGIIAHSVARAQSFDATQKLLIQKLAGIAVIIVAFFVVIDLLQIDLTTFAFFSGALGLAVGFGMQKTVGNLIAGIILLMDRSIKPGDVIV
ncbi:MAG: mechanosensitive ion channel family protein, partial [Sphingomonas sp.]